MEPFFNQPVDASGPRRDALGQSTVEWLAGTIVVAVLALAVATHLGPAASAATEGVRCTVRALEPGADPACPAPSDPGATERASATTPTRLASPPGGDADLPGESIPAALAPYQESDGPAAVTDDDPYTYDLETDTASELRPTIPLKRCDLTRQTPGCPPPPSSPIYDTTYRDPASVAEDARLEKTLDRNVTWAQEYLYQRFGWSGADGQGEAVHVTPHAQRESPPVETGETHYDEVEGGAIHVSDEYSDGSVARATALHELTHVMTRHAIGRLTRGETSPEVLQTSSIVEALSEMAELEVLGDDYIGNLAQPLPAQRKQPWICPKPDGARDPYANAQILLGAYADIARGMGTLTLGGGRPFVQATATQPGVSDLDPAWERAADLRWIAMTKYLPARNVDGELTFGDVRAAFLDAAGDVGLDPTIVSRGFDRQGITSEDWTPPPCSTYGEDPFQAP